MPDEVTHVAERPSNELQELAKSAAETLVTAMATSGWEAVRRRLSAVLGLDPDMQAANDEVRRSPDPEAARATQRIRWEDRIATVLKVRPDAVAPLRHELGATAVKVKGRHNVTGAGSARIVTFGDGPISKVKVDQGDRHNHFGLTPLFAFVRAHIPAAVATVVIIAGGSTAAALHPWSSTTESPNPSHSAAKGSKMTWASIDTSRLPPRAEIISVACPMPDDCWLVGQTDGSSSDHPYDMLAAHLHDGVLQPVALPQSGDTQTDLFQVVCGTSTDCWAAGRLQNSTSNNPFVVLHYDGTKWSIEPDAPTTLLGCAPSGGPCWAGSLDRSSGSSWSQLNVPVEEAQALSCPTTTHCYLLSGVLTLRFSELNGSRLTTFDGPQAPPTADASGAALTFDYVAGDDSQPALVCPALRDCWALDFETTDANGNYVGGLEHFDGTGWTRVSAVQIANPTPSLRALACPAVDDCYLLTVASHGSTAAVVHGHGATWTQVAVLPSGTSQLACASTTYCVAAASTGNSVTVGEPHS